MRAKFIDVVKALLPSSAAWDITRQKNMRRLFEAIAVLPDDLRRELEEVYFDYFPETTRSLERWEQVFQVAFPSAEISLRRDVLAGLWQMNDGGGALIFLEKVLQNVWPEIRIVENVPVGNPRGPSVEYVMVCGNRIAVCGNAKAVCGYRLGNDDEKTMVLRNDEEESTSIPNRPAWWKYCFYVCKSVERDERGVIILAEQVEIPAIFKRYIEYFILRMKQVQTVAVMAVKWV